MTRKCSSVDEAVHFVFDLDDTLYAERDYVQSALAYVGGIVADRFGQTGAAERLFALWATGVSDPIAVLWRELQLPDSARVDAVAAMRKHRPVIDLRPDAAHFLRKLRESGRDYAIVTDGRSVTQRAKLAALGCLDARYISISEEVGLAKTDPARFSIIEHLLGPGRYVYVGDNPAKDFVAPNRSGWLTVMILTNNVGIHAQTVPADTAYHPKVTITGFHELEGAVANASGFDNQR